MGTKQEGQKIQLMELGSTWSKEGSELRTRVLKDKAA